MSHETLDRDDIQATGLEPSTQPKGLALTLKALRSGDYKPTTNYLRHDGCFCVLGVVIDVYLKEHGETWEELDSYNVSTLQVLPDHIASWAFGEGEDCNPLVTVPDALQDDPRLTSAPVVSTSWVPMAQLVDSVGLSFSEIADLLEDTFS